MLERDIRDTALYREVAAFYAALHAPGEERVTDATDIAVRPDGAEAAFTGSLYRDMQTHPVTRICTVDLASGRLAVRRATQGNDRMPRWSPDGRQLAFLSDRGEPGNYQLYVSAGAADGETITTPDIEGTIEYLEWSPDWQRVLLGVAGFGADFAGCQGGHKTLTRAEEGLPTWAPWLDSGDAQNLWRRLFVWERASNTVRAVSPLGTNFWEACWLGEHQLAAVTSASHSEGSWYEAAIQSLDLSTGRLRLLYTSKDQVGVLTAAPSGRHLAFVEAVCSDRMIVAGTLQVLSADTLAIVTCDTRLVDVTHAAWRNEDSLTYTGVRSLETVLGELDIRNGAAPGQEYWASHTRTIGGFNPICAPVSSGGAVAVSEAYAVPPRITFFAAAVQRDVLSLATPATAREEFNAARIEPFTWVARDGLQMQGWLIRPPGPGPFPLVMDIHGGPVWCCRNRWQGRLRGAKALADRGIASLYPNPRGSSGRGLSFARLVKGDMGGEDTFDYLTGIDALVQAGIAAPEQVGVTGISYGGFMSAWLITQETRFAAAAPISCVSDWFSLYLTSQIPDFVPPFLDAAPADPHGRMFARSPAMFAQNVRTPTLQLTGAQDQNTPPTQALEFHRALLREGVTSVLATYPTAGHGIRAFPEVIDATARYVGWMIRYLTGSDDG